MAAGLSRIESEVPGDSLTSNRVLLVVQKKKIGDMELRELEALLISGELNLLQLAERIGRGTKTVKVAVQNLSRWSGNEVSD